MHISSFEQSNKKKIRGLKKKCRAMVEALIAQTSEFPIDYNSEEYWHYHLPVAQSFIDSKHTPQSVRRLCIQTMIDRTQFLSQHKPKNAKSCRVLCLVCLPDLWSSVITIFSSQNYFIHFFDRNNPWQRWTPLIHKDIAKEYNLIIPSNFQVKSYKHECFDDDNPSIVTYVGEIWAIGELE